MLREASAVACRQVHGGRKIERRARWFTKQRSKLPAQCGLVEGQLQEHNLRPEERAFLKEHALKKPLRVPDIWALGVGVVITGAYFGWNLGLKDNGPVAVLVASLIVCLLYLAWVLALAELAVPEGDGVVARAGSRRLVERAEELLAAGEVAWEGVSDLLPVAG